MIPIKLTLRNFMCFRENVPPISFESVHTACISGNNGNGKSALVDAITWALWGQSRADSDDELIHTGESEMQVEFEFAVEKQRYRILRKHSRPRGRKASGQTILEFQTAGPQGYRTLSGDTIARTQQIITRTLRMDYETFINSAFLKQGRANEFTKKRPGERKEVLASILQLALYDQLEEKSRESARGYETNATILNSSIEAIRAELSAGPSLEAELRQASAALIVAEKVTGEQEAKVTELRQKRHILELTKTRLTELSNFLVETERNYTLWSKQAQQCRVRVNDYEHLMSQRAIIEENYTSLVSAKKLAHEMDLKYKQVNNLIQARHRLEMAIVRAGEELNQKHAVAQSRLADLKNSADKIPHFQTQLNQVSSNLRSLDITEANIAAMREKGQELQLKNRSLQDDNQRLTREIEQIEEKIKLLSHDGGVKCPLCESELGRDGQRRLESKYLGEKSTHSEVIINNQAEIDRLKRDIVDLERSISLAESTLKKSRDQWQSQLGQLGKSLADTREAGEKLLAGKKDLDEIENRLARRDFALSEQEALGQIEKEIVRIGYDGAEHERLRSRLSEFERYEQPKLMLDEADRLIVQEKTRLEQACHTADELRSRLEIDNAQRQNLLAEVNLMAAAAADLESEESKLRILLLDQKKIQERLGGVKARLEQLTLLEVRLAEKLNEQAEAAKLEKIYRDLALVFGKKGIQAMLIEMAIPEIEAEANLLLARMTDNRMHIKIETQRPNKKGEVIETLDINIADELGTRNYEMFSGGEAFRIDFAIRIALSRLLARRAGAPLPTLIIDEGFGTQDNIGIEKIKEAITSIQDDFEKILVITHIADFKDAFPARFEVVKTAEGSTVFLN